MKMISKLMMLLAFLPILFVGCDNEDDEGGTVDVSKDGTYIAGSATGSIDVKFADALVEGASFSSYHRPGMYEVYFYLVPGNLEFKTIMDGVSTVYGAKTTIENTLDGSGDQIKGTYKTGELAVGSTTFAISTAGFYHILYDETSMNYWVIPVTKWEWTYNDVELTEATGASATKVEWTKTDVKLATNSAKFRYNDGWKIVTELPILPEEDPLTDGTVVIIFTNLGFNDQELLEPGAGNGDVAKGMYDIKLTWTPAQGFVSKFTKTGDVSNTDYSGYLMGMIGNGVLVADTSWGWGALSYLNSTPAKSGEIYTWNYSGVKIAANGAQEKSFKFRKDNAWDFTLGFTSVTMAGSAATDFIAGSGDGNFGVATEATYDFVLEVNAENDEWTLTAVPAGGPTYDIWGLIGSATPGGWSADTEMTPNTDGSVWTWTGELVEGEYKFRANGLWDNQIGDNGAGGATFSTNATAWKIAAGAGGNYTIVLNSVTPAVTVTKN